MKHLMAWILCNKLSSFLKLAITCMSILHTLSGYDNNLLLFKNQREGILSWALASSFFSDSYNET